MFPMHIQPLCFKIQFPHSLGALRFRLLVLRALGSLIDSVPGDDDREHCAVEHHGKPHPSQDLTTRACEDLPFWQATKPSRLLACHRVCCSTVNPRSVAPLGGLPPRFSMLEVYECGLTGRAVFRFGVDVGMYVFTTGTPETLKPNPELLQFEPPNLYWFLARS